MATAKTESPAIVQRLVNDALRNLRLAGCAYRVMDADGGVFENDIDRFEPKKPRAQYGKVKSVYFDLINGIQVGDVVVVPVPEDVELHSVQSGICATLGESIGTGNYTTHLNNSSRAVEVMRLA